MLSQQEALEAMAGRSAEGKPLVFVSQQDYAALRGKHEALVIKVRKQRRYWVVSSVVGAAIIAAMAVLLIRLNISAAGLVFECIRTDEEIALSRSAAK